MTRVEVQQTSTNALYDLMFDRANWLNNCNKQNLRHPSKPQWIADIKMIATELLERI